MLGRDDFVGAWRLQRLIDDRMSAQTGDFQGTADLRVSEAGLAYSETGKMRLGAGPIMTAQRQYNWTFRSDSVVVTFEDGAAFHSFVPAGLAPGTDHPCGDDFYRVVYDFTDWPIWQTTWDVMGPRKDYTSVSTYQR